MCTDKKDAIEYIKAMDETYIHDWEFLKDGRVKLYLKDGWKDHIEK